MPNFKDGEHLVRLAAVFLIAFLAFLGLRAVLVPKSFGQFGHYRGDALKEVASKKPVFAGQTACVDCHSDVLDVKKAGKHAGVHCEACHGALARHAENPADVVPQLPDTAILCARCHQQNLAKPASFPQVDAKEHSGGEKCKTCHVPHDPLKMPGGAK